MPESWDDDELLVALGQALASRRAVPAEFAEAGRQAFAWRDIDAEFAELIHDSLASAEGALTLRAEPASVRALTFTSSRLTIELEVVEDALLGQVVPAQPVAITVEPIAGDGAVIEADDIGCFSLRPMPPGLFRLRVRTATGFETLTGWITPDRD